MDANITLTCYSIKQQCHQKDNKHYKLNSDLFVTLYTTNTILTYLQCFKSQYQTYGGGRYIISLSYTLKQLQISKFVIFSEGCSHYILWMTSPPMSRNCVLRENKVAVSAFLLYFPPTCRIQFPHKMVILVKIIGKSVYLSLLLSAGQEFLFLFFSSDMEEIPLSESVICRIQCMYPNKKSFQNASK